MDKKKNDAKKHARKIYGFASILTFCIGALALFASLTITKSLSKNSRQIVNLPQSTVAETGSASSASQATFKNEPITKKSTAPPQTKASADIAVAEDSDNNFEESYPVFKKNEENFKLSLPCDGEISKKFSMTSPLKSKTMGDFRTHNGIDIKTKRGTNVCAAADGVIEKIYTDYLLGITIEIGHTENLKTQYSNLADIDTVAQGDEVKKGQYIGCVGDSASGEKLEDAHIHFSVIRNNEYIDPLGICE